MEKFWKVCLMSLLLFLVPTIMRAQLTTDFYASATILQPVGLSTAYLYKYRELSAKGINMRRTSSIDLIIDGVVAEVYSITLPTELVLLNNNGFSSINTVINAHTSSLCNGQKKIQIESEIMSETEQMQGKYSSAAFEVTVNFN